MNIAVLTSGGDAPGMNACVRATVRYGIYKGVNVYVVKRGYVGLLADDMELAGKRTVSDIIHRGGTIIKTARCEEFKLLENQQRAADNLSLRGIDGVVVIGGDGSFRGAQDLYVNCGVKTVGIPGTIDNDLNYTDFTLGFDTAVNTALDAINRLRDTMTSHERLNIVEVMGRRCGDIALYSGIAGGAEIVLIPEIPFNIDELCERIKVSMSSGKTSNLIVVAEGVMHAPDLMDMIKAKMNVSVRTTTLGHIQRGGMPSMADRVLAARFAVGAVDALLEGKGGRVVGIHHNDIFDMDITEALNMPSKFNRKLYNIANILGK